MIFRWLSERFDIESLATRISDHVRKPVPAHANVFFTLGSLALLLFGIQVITGLLLMVYYKPTVRDAYTSVEYIMTAVPFGWLMRQVHAWSANLMILVVFLHMLKTFVYGGYKKPRETTWVLGVAILLVVLGFGFTGYLLPWNQLAYWATSVAAEAPRSLPLAGPIVSDLMRGGSEVGEATLGRFFVAHVALLPIALVLLAGLHLVIVRLQSTSPLTRTDEPEPSQEEILSQGGRPFFPHHVIKEGIVAYFSIGVVLTLAILWPFESGEPANPFETPPGIKPEWYFLPMFQLLKYLPKPVAVALPGLVVGLLFLLPFLDRSPERHPRKRLGVIGLGALFLLVVLVLGTLGKISDSRIQVFGRTIYFDVRGLPTVQPEDSP